MLEKKYSKSKDTAKVTFTFPSSLEAETVYLVGGFNDWSETDLPMKHQKDGSFSLSLDLTPGKDYEFRYLVNGTEWHNEWEADAYIPNPYSGDNSVVKV
ncbi:MAG TPA: isoamylase early set domain-containing protein [Candidatus Limnocylindrales bacterium]|nr:isoamylase early set domain-containing protein [Candidatus Limnocylindrales bacterium]